MRTSIIYGSFTLLAAASVFFSFFVFFVREIKETTWKTTGCYPFLASFVRCRPKWGQEEMFRPSFWLFFVDPNPMGSIPFPKQLMPFISPTSPKNAFQMAYPNFLGVTKCHKCHNHQPFPSPSPLKVRKYFFRCKASACALSARLLLHRSVGPGGKLTSCPPGR